MGKNIFDVVDFGLLQTMLFPVIAALGGPDIQDFIAGKAEAFEKAAELLGETSELMAAVAAALSDGIITNDEINMVISEAADISEALRELTGVINDRLIQGNS